MPTKEVPSILYQQLYLFRIINPQLSFTLSITLTPSEIIEYNFNGGQALLSILSSPFKLLSSIRHYFNARLVFLTIMYVLYISLGSFQPIK